jgi:purine-binding chemotaxis protein CheW
MADECLQAVIFDVASVRYALAIDPVREIVRAASIVPLPKAPAVVNGVVNYRGRLAPVIDLRVRFRLPTKPVSCDEHFVIAQAGNRTVAIRTDRVAEIQSIRASDIEQANRVVAGSEYVAGIAKLPDGLVLITDVESFLTQAESQALAEALGDASAGGPP